MDATHTSCSKCNMKLKQKPGGENQLISNKKPLALSQQFFCVKISFIEDSSDFLFLGKPWY